MSTSFSSQPLFDSKSRPRRFDDRNSQGSPEVVPDFAESPELLPRGDRNANPPGIGFVDLLREDFATYDRNPTEPGFWAVAVHRFGNWRMGIRPRVARAPLSLLYKAMFTSVNWLWGIDIGYNMKLGRRVRLWHHGGMVLSARSIGDDVHIRHNTTFGVARRDQDWKKPVIQDRVDVGVGACILGDVTIGHDSVVGANAVVLKSCEPFSTMVGVPAHAVEKHAGEQAQDHERDHERDHVQEHAIRPAAPAGALANVRAPTAPVKVVPSRPPLGKTVLPAPTSSGQMNRLR